MKNYIVAIIHQSDYSSSLISYTRCACYIFYEYLTFYSYFRTIVVHLQLVNMYGRRELYLGLPFITIEILTFKN